MIGLTCGLFMLLFIKFFILAPGAGIFLRFYRDWWKLESYYGIGVQLQTPGAWPVSW